ncbi:MAG: hypothetical protein ACRDWV_09050 [Acidimicrobiales bacterium]
MWPRPWWLPRAITKAYVQSVLSALEAVQAKATANIVSHRAYTPAAAALIHSVTTPDEYYVDHQTWLTDLQSGLQDLPPHLSPVIDEVQQVFPSTSTCIFVSVIRNYSGANTKPPPVGPNYAILRTGSKGSPNPG